MNKLLEKLKIDETNTKPVRKPKYYSKVKDNIPLIEDYNIMADLLFLPTTKKGYKYLLVIVDLATDEFDIEPIKNKSSETVLKALKVMFKRKHVKQPYASFNTDGGGEFKGAVEQYMKNRNIYHKSGVSGRHTQVANVERLNKTLGRLFNGYMSTKEQVSGKTYKQWTDIVNVVREELNKIRKKILPDNIFDVDYKVPSTAKAKYNIGDVVLYQLDKPKDGMGRDLKDEKFRMGDLRWSVEPRKITEVFSYAGKVPYRYMLEGKSNVSYTATQLKLSSDRETKYILKAIVGKRKRNKRIEYKVWWQNYPKKEATWVSRMSLVKDGLQSYINQYNKANNK